MPWFKLLFLSLFLFAGQGFAAAGAAYEIQSFEGQAQGTTYHISYRGKVNKGIERKVAQSLKQFDKLFSNYQPDSAISRFNASFSTDWVPVDGELAQMITDALDVSRHSAGTFDVTIGAVLKVWGFGPYPKPKQSVPDDKDIKAALLLSGYDKLEVRMKPPALKKKVAGLLIDLSGIAQGASVDGLAMLFDKAKIDSYIIEVGGEMITKGEKAPGKPWIVAIEAPTDSEGSIAQTLQTKGMGLSTSGDYRKFFVQNGKRFSHIFDPRVGRPIETHIASASVLAKTAREADAYAKVYMILTPAEAKALSEKLKMPVMVMMHRDMGFESIYYTGFESFLIRQ